MCDDKISKQIYSAFNEMEGNLVKGIQDTITAEVLPPDFKDRMQILGEYAMPEKDFQKYIEETDKYKWQRLHRPNTLNIKEGMKNIKDKNGMISEGKKITSQIETIKAIENGMAARHGTFKSDSAFAEQCALNAEATTSLMIADEKSDLDKLKKYYSTYLRLYESMYNYQLSLGSLIDGKLKQLKKYTHKIDTYKQNLYIDGRKDTYENSNYDFYKSMNYYLLIFYACLFVSYFIFTPFFQEKKYTKLKLVSVIVVYIMIPFILPSLLALIHAGYESIIEYNNMKGDIISYPHIIEDTEKYA